jgi:DNA repair protein RadA/Sms
MDKPVDKSVVLCGEVGLAGEVRSINRIEHRLYEAQSLGFKTALIPSSNLKKSMDRLKLDIELKPISYLKEAFQQLF